MSTSGSPTDPGMAERRYADCLHRFTFENLPVRGQWVRLYESVAAAEAAKQYPAPIKRLLNQMFAAVAMFADNLKFQGAVALQSKGDGALIRSLAECREQKYLRGIAHLDNNVPLPTNPENLTEWLNNGQLALSLIPPADSQQVPYQGLVPLEGATLSENLETYLQHSEQLPSRMYLVEDQDCVTGLLLQRLPSANLASDMTLDAEEEAWHSIITLADTVTEQELASLPPQDMLRRLFAEYPCRLFPARELSFKCSCSRAKSDRTLRVLEAEDLQSLLEERGSIDVDCEFCGTRYSYDKIDVGHLLGGQPSRPDEPTVH